MSLRSLPLTDDVALQAGTRAEQQLAFMFELSERLAGVQSEREILRAAVEVLSRFMRARGIFVGECHEGENRLVLTVSWAGGADLAAPRTCRLDQLGDASFRRRYLAGGLAVTDCASGERLPAEIFGEAVGSFAVGAVPRAGGNIVTIVIVDEAPRTWGQDELRVLGDFVLRVWPLVERARNEVTLTLKLRAAEAVLTQAGGPLVGDSDLDLVSRITAASERRRRLYETTLSNTPDVVCVFDLQRRFTYANTALLQTWGRGWNDVIGKTCLEVGYPDWQAAKHDNELDTVIATKCSVRGEVPFRSREGERIHDYIFVPVLGADGEVEAIAGTTRDVTVLKQAEYLMAGQARALELMAKGASLAGVLEALCDVIDQQATERLCASILLMQDDGRELRPVAGRHMPATWSEAVAPWIAGPESGACGNAVFRRERVVCPDLENDPRWSDRLRHAALQHGFRACWSTPIVSSGGAVLGTVALYYPRVHQPSSSEIRLVEIITRTAGIAIERSRAEEGLKKHSEWLGLLWEAAAVLLTIEDPEALMRALFLRVAPNLGLDVFLNHMFKEGSDDLQLFSFAGVTPELAGGVTRLRPDSPLFGDVLQTHEPYSVSFVQSSPDPAYEVFKTFGLQAYACVPLVAGERLLGTLSFGSRQREHFEADEIEFMRTVTRYLTIAYERLRLVRELRESDRKKDDFIALLAHELRNPLAPLRNGLAVMRLAADDPTAVARARTIMERQLAHMVRLIDDLLDVSRISLNKMLLRRSLVSLSDVMVNAVETARPAIEAGQHDLTVSLPTEPVTLDGDVTRLAQVFGNLLTNAAKYTPRRGAIAVRAEREGDVVNIVVEDNGIGLRADSLRSIFGMFSQVDHRLERTTGGLGIGLALVKGLTEMHGGCVRAESDGLGLGSRFTVSLPVAIAVDVPSAEQLQTSRERSRRRILLADDNRDAAESLATMLRLSGNEVHTVHDGLEAVERAEAIKPEVVLMDVGMPHLSGYDATRRIRSHAWGQPMVIIAVTGWGQESDRRKSRDAGCDDHLVKPVDLTQLTELISSLCRRLPKQATR